MDYSTEVCFILFYHKNNLLKKICPEKKNLCNHFIKNVWILSKVSLYRALLLTFIFYILICIFLKVIYNFFNQQILLCVLKYLYTEYIHYKNLELLILSEILLTGIYLNCISNIICSKFRCFIHEDFRPFVIGYKNQTSFVIG